MGEEKKQRKPMTLRRFLLQYVLPFAAGIVIVFVYAVLLDVFNSENTASDVFALLSNGSLIVGAVLAGVGLLVFSADQGTFDGIGFAFKGISRQFIPGAALLQHRESYQHYVERKHRTSSEFLHFVFVGLFFIAMSGLMLVFYYVFA